MTSPASTAPSPPSGGKPKRHLRNYLLDPRFQLKYTGMVVLVTVIVASVLGSFAYRSSKAQTESMTIQMAMMDIDGSLQSNLVEMAADQARLGLSRAGLAHVEYGPADYEPTISPIGQA